MQRCEESTISGGMAAHLHQLHVQVPILADRHPEKEEKQHKRDGADDVVQPVARLLGGGLHKRRHRQGAQ